MGPTKQFFGVMATALSLMIMFSTLVTGQNTTGNITGVIADASGSVVPAVTVTARNIGTSATLSAATDSEGIYSLRNLPIGVYELTVEARGFEKQMVADLRLQVNETLRVDLKLKVGGTTESITVASAAVTVDTVTPTLKTVVDEKRISELPLNGRNATQLMRLVAGVTADNFANVTSGTTYPGVTPVSVNGSRSNSTNYILDGAQNNDVYSNAPSPMPNPDALQEFSVQTNNFSAEFGRQSGGIVNAVTKSGTNQLHGSAFEFVRNNALNAANWFAPVVNGAKVTDGLKRNQFGATLGGPVVLPKLYNGKDKSFFFFSYQSTILKRTPTEASRIVPTAAQREGNFAGLGKPIIDPSTGQAYPGNIIPKSQISPISNYMLGKLPIPPSGNRITISAPNNFDDQQILVRGDHAFSDKNRLSGRYYKSWAATPAYLNPANYLEWNGGGNWRNESVSITDTHVFGSTVTNQALFSVSRTDGYFFPVQPDKSMAALGVKMWNGTDVKWDTDVAGYFRFDTGDTNSFPRREWQILDTVRWTKGKHQISMGGEYGRGGNDITNNFRSSGVFTFNGISPFTTDSLADFMIGRYNSLTQGIGEYKGTRFNRVGFFFQDSMRLARRLTVDLGVRWEPFLPYTDTEGKLSVIHPGKQSTRYVNAPKGILYPGDPDIPAGAVPSIFHNFAPRIGFAWDVFGDGKTAVRGGYGMFFDSANTIMTNSAANQAPFGTVVGVFGNAANSFADPWAGTTNPFPGSTNPPSTVAFPAYSSQFSFAPDFRNPYVQSWNLTVEREVFGGLVARGSYAASKGTRLGAPRDWNPAIYAPGATTATTNQRRIYAPALGQTTIVESVGNSTFHSAQLTLERRFAKGFTALANYQLAKSLDDTSQNKINGPIRVNPFNQAFDKGLSEFNKKHVFNMSGLWDLPFRPKGKVTNMLLGGWSLNGIVNLASGQPVNIVSGVDNARSGTPNQRANIVGSPYFEADRTNAQITTEYLRKSAFAPNTLGAYGTLGRNVFIGPGYANVDLGLAKAFAFTESFRALLRFEAFNAFNRPNFNQPNGAQNNGNFMRITTAQDPRILQIAMRVTW